MFLILVINNQAFKIIKRHVFFLGDFDANHEITYKPKLKTNGLYIFVLEGNVTINDEKIAKRDAFGIWDYDSVSLHFDSQTQVLLMDVPIG
jgi:hypothetical protein